MATWLGSSARPGGGQAGAGGGLCYRRNHSTTFASSLTARPPGDGGKTKLSRVKSQVHERQAIFFDEMEGKVPSKWPRRLYTPTVTVGLRRRQNQSDLAFHKRLHSAGLHGHVLIGHVHPTCLMSGSLAPCSRPQAWPPAHPRGHPQTTQGPPLETPLVQGQ